MRYAGRINAKLIHKENNLDISDEMGDIEDFITKYLKQFFTALRLDELNNLPPAFQNLN